MSRLAELGWSELFATLFDQTRETTDARRTPSTVIPARVAGEDRGGYRLWAEPPAGRSTLASPWPAELHAAVSGRLRHEATSAEELPAVGDWVVAEARPGEDGRATIHQVLPRRSVLKRKKAGAATEVQVLGANLDTVFLVAALGDELSLRRIERTLVLIGESGARPVLVLNKADLSRDPGAATAAAAAVAAGAAVHAVSALTGDGVGAVEDYLGPGTTTALVGPSGVGKSSLINRLVGAEAAFVGAIREVDGRGRHTTTARSLIRLARGGLLMDTPGLREVGLWDTGTGTGLGAAFEDIEALARSCRFGDCRHDAEPGCAIGEALESQALDAGRFASYIKLGRELAYLEAKHDARKRLDTKRRWKAITRAMRRRDRWES